MQNRWKLDGNGNEYQFPTSFRLPPKIRMVTVKTGIDGKSDTNVALPPKNRMNTGILDGNESPLYIGDFST